MFAKGKLLGRFTTFPLDICRIQSGKLVSLRDRAVQTKEGKASFDLDLHNGKVLPALGEDFLGPNGMSMRPPTPYFINFAENFRGRRVVVFYVPKGTILPQNLVLLHEHTDHYSLQTAVPCSLPELNERLTKFLHENAQALTVQELAKRSIEGKLNLQ
jgi:hypothetical protein